MALIDALLNHFVGARFAVDSVPTFLARGAVLAVPALVVGVLAGTTRAERRVAWSRLRGSPIRAARISNSSR